MSRSTKKHFRKKIIRSRISILAKKLSHWSNEKLRGADVGLRGLKKNKNGFISAQKIIFVGPRCHVGVQPT